MADHVGEYNKYTMDDNVALVLKSSTKKQRNKKTSHSDVKPFKFIRNGKTKKQNSEDIQATEEGLDDIDGAMFSRQRKHNNEADYRNPNGRCTLGSAMFTRPFKVKRENASAFGSETFDDTDGAMFSRLSYGGKRPARLDISGAKFGNNIGRQVPRSPSADWIHSIRFPNLSDNFPVKPFPSAGILTQHGGVGSDAMDYGLDCVPGNFDISYTGSNASSYTLQLDQNDGKRVRERSDDDFDSALFNRVNSFKTKDEISNTSKGGFEKTANRDNVVQRQDNHMSKSLPDITDHVYIEPTARKRDSDFNNTTKTKSSKSLPSCLDGVVDHNFLSGILHRTNVNDETPVVEKVQRQEFIPLRENIGFMPNPDNEVRNRLLPSDRARRPRPCRLKYMGTVMFPAVSVILFLADIGTDINLALNYRADGETIFFIVTVICIGLPSLLMSIVDLSWIYRDKEDVDVHTEVHNSYYSKRCWKISRIIMGLLSFGRVVRTISHIYHSLRSKLYGEEYHKQRKIEERRDYCMLDVINAFTESCPQLIAQMVLLYKYRKPFTADLGLSIVCSWLSIGWAYSSYYRYQKEALHGRKDVKLLGIMVFCLAVLSALATRICCISLFLVYYPSWIGAIVLFIHFFVMLVWIAFCQKPNLEGMTSSKPGRILYYLFFSYLSIMYFVNLKDSKSRLRLLVYFFIYYLENSLAAGLLLLKTSFDYSQSVNEFRWSLLIVPLGMFFHILLLSIFYKCIHPVAKRSQENQNIDSKV